MMKSITEVFCLSDGFILHFKLSFTIMEDSRNRTSIHDPTVLMPCASRCMCHGVIKCKVTLLYEYFIPINVYVGGGGRNQLKFKIFLF